MTGRSAGGARLAAWPRFGRARGGNVAILVALGGSVLMGAGAVGLDLGQVFQARRKAQGAADIAAMTAAADPARADALARRSLGDNGYDAAGAIVETGSYDASTPGVAPGARFTVGADPANAVRVALSTAVPATFGRAIGLPGAVPIRVGATLAAASPILDRVLDNTLRSLGLRVGYADIDMDGMLCSQAVPVQ